MVVLEDVDFPELIQKLFLVLIHRNYNLKMRMFSLGRNYILKSVFSQG